MVCKKRVRRAALAFGSLVSKFGEEPQVAGSLRAPVCERVRVRSKVAGAGYRERMRKRVSAIMRPTR